jgi:hypothetical protein
MAKPKTEDGVRILPQLRLEVSDEAIILERLDNGWTVARADAVKGKLDLHITCEDPEDSPEGAATSLAQALSEALSEDIMSDLAEVLAEEHLGDD